MDEIRFDWLQQINYEAWKRRIYQLRRELSQERIQAQQHQPVPQEVALPLQTEQTSTNKPRPIKSSDRTK